ncbi:MAG: nucleoside-triphosphatase [Promethearchaeota archaeon]
MDNFKQKILITGPPRCGKSTLISRLIEHLRKNFKIYGFITPEIRKQNKREGFNVEDLNSKKRFPLAKVGDFKTNFKLGRYSVFIKDFENYINNFLEPIYEVPGSIFCIDEIGKMELFSKKFQEFIKKLFQSNNLVIATVGEKIKHPIKDYILNVSNSILINLNLSNQDEIFNKIVSIVK